MVQNIYCRCIYQAKSLPLLQTLPLRLITMAKYIMAPMSNRKTAEGDVPFYPRVLIEHRTNSEEIAQMLSNSTSFTKGDVLGIISALGEVIASELVAGHAVYLDGIGRFSPSLKLKDGVEPEQEHKEGHRNANSIEFHSINFRPCKELITTCNLKGDLTRAKIHKSDPMSSTLDDRCHMAVNYIKASGFLKVRDYVDLTGLSRNKASQELRELKDAGFLGCRGGGSHVVYILPDTTK